MNEQPHHPDDGRDAADGCYRNIMELLAALRAAQEQGSDRATDDAFDAIYSTPLSVEVRSAWTPIGSKLEASEFCLLVTTGGPAVRLVGTLGEYNEPVVARLEHQDWFMPWVEWPQAHEPTLIEFCRCFCFVSE